MLSKYAIVDSCYTISMGMQGAGYRNREVRATSWLTNYHNLTVNSRSIYKVLFLNFYKEKERSARAHYIDRQK